MEERSADRVGSAVIPVTQFDELEKRSQDFFLVQTSRLPIPAEVESSPSLLPSRFNPFM